MLNTTRAPTFGDLQRGLHGPEWDDALGDGLTALQKYPMLVDDTGTLTVSEILARARKAKARFEAEGRKLGVVAVDHIGLITPSDRYRGNKVAETGEASNALRAAAKELNCCVIAFCQLSRKVEDRDDKRPGLADLRWTGDLEQDAHVVMFLYRESYYMAQDPAADPGVLAQIRFQLDCLIRKNRNGPTDDVRLWCSIAHASIQDWELAG